MFEAIGTDEWISQLRFRLLVPTVENNFLLRSALLWSGLAAFFAAKSCSSDALLEFGLGFHFQRGLCSLWLFSPLHFTMQAAQARRELPLNNGVCSVGTSGNFGPLGCTVRWFSVFSLHFGAKTAGRSLPCSKPYAVRGVLGGCEIISHHTWILQCIETVTSQRGSD